MLSLRRGETLLRWKALSLLLVTCLSSWTQANPDLCFGQVIRGEHREALTSCQHAASQGDARALFLLGEMHLYGLGVEKDPDRALTFHQRASLLGYGKATKRWVDQLLFSLTDGSPLRDPREGLDGYLLAWQQGYRSLDHWECVSAQLMLIPEVREEWRSWVERGDVCGGQLAVGEAAMNPHPRTVEVAMGVLRQAAFYRAGDSYSYGLTLCEGQLGFAVDAPPHPRDCREGVQWLLRAARMGETYGSTLAEAYTEGILLPRDLQKAAWYTWRADNAYLTQKFQQRFPKVEAPAVLRPVVVSPGQGTVWKGDTLQVQVVGPPARKHWVTLDDGATQRLLSDANVQALGDGLIQVHTPFPLKDGEDVTVRVVVETRDGLLSEPCEVTLVYRKGNGTRWL